MRFVVFLFLLLPLSCFIGAAYMAINHVDGWGWFLFVGLVLAGGFSYGQKSGPEI